MRLSETTIFNIRDRAFQHSVALSVEVHLRRALVSLDITNSIKWLSDYSEWDDVTLEAVKYGNTFFEEKES